MSDRAKILLVDDEPGMLRYIRTLLEVDNHTVQTASTGEEALELVEKGLQPNLVLLDLLMPTIRKKLYMQSAWVQRTTSRSRSKKPNSTLSLINVWAPTSKIMRAKLKTWATRLFLWRPAQTCASCARKQRWSRMWTYPF